MKLRILSASLALVGLFPSLQSRAEGTVDAVLAPSFGFQMASEEWKSGARIQYGFDFARLSAGVSLNVFYASGLGYKDYGGTLRFFGSFAPVSSLEAFTLIWGAGAGARYIFDSEPAVTGISDSTPGAGRIHLSPFVRAMYDFNGWVAPFIDLSYDIGLGGWGKEFSALKRSSSGFVASIGVAIEIER